jgi:hypothetical protein
MKRPFVSVSEIGTLPATYAFEQVGSGNIWDTMKWQGTPGAAITDLEAVLTDSMGSSDGLRPIRYLCKPSEHPISNAFWHPGHLMRSIIDNTTSEARIDLVNKAAHFALRFYAHGTGSDQLRALRESTSMHDLLGKSVRQPSDGATLYAMEAERTAAAAQRLQDTITNDVLMIPLCHGGFVAGVQTALQYHRLNPDSDINVYPIRYSRDKMRDTMPQISVAEMEYIKAGVEGRTVVVFDEDSYSGHSVGRTIQTLQRHLPGQQIVGLVSNDVREEEAIELQGTWWENYEDSPL